MQHQKGSRHSMVFDTAFKLNHEVAVQAAFPELVEGESGVEWRMGGVRATSVDADDVQVVKDQMTLEVDPMTQVHGEVEWIEGVISALPVHVDYKVKFDDDSEHTFKLEGFYDQTTSAGYRMGKKEVKLGMDQTCRNMGRVGIDESQKQVLVE